MNNLKWIISLIFVFILIAGLNAAFHNRKSYNGNVSTEVGQETINTTDIKEQKTVEEPQDVNSESVVVQDEKLTQENTPEPEISEDMPTLKIDKDSSSQDGEYCMFTELAYKQKEKMKLHLYCEESPKWTNDCKEGLLLGDLCVKKFEVASILQESKSFGLRRVRNNTYQVLAEACDNEGMRFPTDSEIEFIEKHHREIVDFYKVDTMYRRGVFRTASYATIFENITNTTPSNLKLRCVKTLDGKE